MDGREGLPRSDSQRRSNSKVGRKGPRSGNDLFVCFAPRTTLNLVSVSRPVLSPARDKGKEAGGRRSGRTLSSSIFSKGAAKKQGFEAGEEPTSPKVTCIGQVRAKSKHNKKGKSLQERKGGAGKASQQQIRSLTRESAQEEAKKQSACPSFAKDFSCFGLPCDNSYRGLPSFRGEKKSSGTVFAKSLVLIQREDEDKALAVGAPTKQIGGKPFSLEEELKRGAVEAPIAAAPAELENQANILTTPAALPAVVEEASCIRLDGDSDAIMAKETVEDPISKDQTDVEEDDTFEAEPPPPNALLIMRSKVEHQLRVVAPPASINITLKRSTSAPAQCRTSEDGDDQLPAKEAYYGHTDQQFKQQEVSRDTYSIMSAEDLRKPAAAQKSFLQRCKSVSQSFTRSNSLQSAVSTQSSAAPIPSTSCEPAEGEKTSPRREAKLLQVKQEAPADGKKDDELFLVNEAVSRRRSDSEALKVSLDVVPETWLWEAWTIRQQSKDTSDSGRRPDMRLVGGASAAEWLDAELEASLWKSCKVNEGRKEMGSAIRHVDAPTLSEEDGSTADQCLDAEVEATLWRSCSVVASHGAEDLQTEPKTGDLAEIAKAREVANMVEKEEAGRNDTYFGRSSSVGSQRGKHIREQLYSLRRSSSVGAGQQQERGYIEKKNSEHNAAQGEENTQNPPEVSMEERVCDSRRLRVGEADIATSNEEESSTGNCVVEDELVGTSTSGPDNCLSAEETERMTIREQQGAFFEVRSELLLNPDDETAEELLQRIERDEAYIVAPSPSSVLDRPAPPPSPVPATPPEAVLFLRYDLGAFRISLDASANMEVGGDIEQQQQNHQKAVLEAMSHLHIHDVQRTYTRLLKAASGKERTSLSSAAFRLQRCKSEPVRLAASY